MTFSLHPQLVQDCGLIGRTRLCELLLFNHQLIPWFILVPRRADVSEIYQLSEEEQRQLMIESATLGQTVMETLHGDKLNVAAIGNIVPQLHLHHIVRFKNDPVWPQPVWGNIQPAPFTASDLAQQCQKYRTSLANFII